MSTGTERCPVALVTGGSRGIGRGVAVELARAGYSVAINYRGNAAAAAETEQLCTASAGAANGGSQRFLSVQADIADRRARLEMLDRIDRDLGGIDVLINNAGVAPRQRMDILEAGEESFSELLSTNLQGPYFLTQAVAARWLASGHPGTHERRIVFITSISADTASLNRGEYCVSKAGLAMAVQLFALRLAEYGIPVFEVRPGIIKTDMTSAVEGRYDGLIAEGLVPQKRWGMPEDVGRAVRGLVSSQFSFSTGSVIYADGGLHIARL